MSKPVAPDLGGWYGRFAARIRPVIRNLAMANPFRYLPRFFQALLIVVCPIFDQAWFIARSGTSGGRFGLAMRFADAATESGLANPLFNADWYRTRYGFRGSAGQALLHYWLLGDRLGLRPHPWFDAGFFRRHYRRPLWSGAALMLFLRKWRSYPTGHPLFDSVWYLETYADVRESGENPLLHFALYGLQENRRPNAYFVPEWYLEHYPDVARSQINPALHYCLYGAAEGRNPGPDFDSVAYLARYPAVALSRLDALSHFLTVGRYAGADCSGRRLKVSDLQPKVQSMEVPDSGDPIDVVIPVYRGLEETRACIESVLRSSSYHRIRLRLHNDASPEPEVVDYLRQIKVRHPEVILVESAVNQGFVVTVNGAMRAACESEDCRAIILLNSDAEVANDWVERLLFHAYKDHGSVATVTALSNNATICSYPKIGENELPAGCSTGDLDRLAARVNRGESVEVPTGVGFCMLITAKALQLVGFFDEEAFGRGYGEEVDFCMRARAAGMRNLLALDVFVRHIGEVSFADVSKPGKVIAQKILQERYPFFNAQVAAFVAADPGLPARIRLTLARWRMSPGSVCVLITHALGGGTERRVQEIAASLMQEGNAIIIRPVKLHANRVSIENPAAFDGFKVDVEIRSAAEMADLLALIGTHSIQVHHVLGFGGFIREGIALYDKDFDFIVHDYYVICPQVTLTDRQARYCGEPSASGCDACIAERPTHGATDIRNWRINQEWLVLGANRVVAPSQDTARRIERYTGRRPDVQYHEPEVMSPAIRPRVAQAEFRVVVIGVLAPHKGRATVISVASAAREFDLPLTLHLIGDPQGEVPRRAQKRLTYTGNYREGELEGLISEANADAFLFAAPWPETYSYTLSAAMKTGRPIVATNIGAFTERLKDYHSALLVPWDISGEELARQIVSYLRSLQKSNTGDTRVLSMSPARPDR